FVFTLAFFFGVLFFWVKAALLLFVAVCIWDLLFLFVKKSPLIIKRSYPDKLSNGDYNDFLIILESLYPSTVIARVLEELPVQFQERNFEYKRVLRATIPEEIHYQLRPIKRGVYSFGNCVALVRYLGLFERRII